MRAETQKSAEALAELQTEMRATNHLQHELDRSKREWAVVAQATRELVKSQTLGSPRHKEMLVHLERLAAENSDVSHSSDDYVPMQDKTTRLEHIDVCLTSAKFPCQEKDADLLKESFSPYEDPVDRSIDEYWYDAEEDNPSWGCSRGEVHFHDAGVQCTLLSSEAQANLQDDDSMLKTRQEVQYQDAVVQCSSWEEQPDGSEPKYIDWLNEEALRFEVETARQECATLASTVDSQQAALDDASDKLENESSNCASLLSIVDARCADLCSVSESVSQENADMYAKVQLLSSELRSEEAGNEELYERNQELGMHETAARRDEQRLLRELVEACGNAEKTARAQCESNSLLATIEIKRRENVASEAKLMLTSQEEARAAHELKNRLTCEVQWCLGLKQELVQLRCHMTREEQAYSRIFDEFEVHRMNEEKMCFDNEEDRRYLEVRFQTLKVAYKSEEEACLQARVEEQKYTELHAASVDFEAEENQMRREALSHVFAIERSAFAEERAELESVLKRETDLVTDLQAQVANLLTEMEEKDRSYKTSEASAAFDHSKARRVQAALMEGTEAEVAELNLRVQEEQTSCKQLRQALALAEAEVTSAQSVAAVGATARVTTLASQLEEEQKSYLQSQVVAATAEAESQKMNSSLILAEAKAARAERSCAQLQADLDASKKLAQKADIEDGNLKLARQEREEAFEEVNKQASESQVSLSRANAALEEECKRLASINEEVEARVERICQAESESEEQKAQAPSPHETSMDNATSVQLQALQDKLFQACEQQALLQSKLQTEQALRLQQTLDLQELRAAHLKEEERATEAQKMALQFASEIEHMQRASDDQSTIVQSKLCKANDELQVACSRLEAKLQNSLEDETQFSTPIKSSRKKSALNSAVDALEDETMGDGTSLEDEKKTAAEGTVTCASHNEGGVESLTAVSHLCRRAQAEVSDFGPTSGLLQAYRSFTEELGAIQLSWQKRLQKEPDLDSVSDASGIRPCESEPSDRSTPYRRYTDAPFRRDEDEHSSHTTPMNHPPRLYSSSHMQFAPDSVRAGGLSTTEQHSDTVPTPRRAPFWCVSPLATTSISAATGSDNDEMPTARCLPYRYPAGVSNQSTERRAPEKDVETSFSSGHRSSISAYSTTALPSWIYKTIDGRPSQARLHP
eukprot:gnl/MRDRNA2_/MRDRNA2_79991_c0_seq1.p1 gnl/MRDRNA2_/MRDRNA2_79991_c0~~gnl/MRDRNA2_/MRDRNA2_79991_c0_seq1.p1  ORF type:complete len:1234 (+),score=323.02 gnl/MRDRNA2_/MRDRNA2_79991_c0_seq1:224-3703(+)